MILIVLTIVFYNSLLTYCYFFVYIYTYANFYFHF